MSNPIITLLRHMYDNNLIIDASKGGLVIGPRHSEGGIKMILLENDSINFVGEMEGGEFLINTFASQKFHKRLFEINSYKGEYQPINETISVRKIIVPKGGMIILGGPQTIIKRSATSKYLNELQEINETTISLFPAQI